MQVLIESGLLMLYSSRPFLHYVLVRSQMRISVNCYFYNR